MNEIGEAIMVIPSRNKRSNIGENFLERKAGSRTSLQELSKLPKPAFLKEKMPISANVKYS
jgi:hypothetical protein